MTVFFHVFIETFFKYILKNKLSMFLASFFAYHVWIIFSKSYIQKK